jgi:RNA polymerase sigma-70 factor, ECF subfamily
MTVRSSLTSQLDDPVNWVDRYGDALFRYVGARVSNREVAEDLVQETFLAAFRQRKSFDGKSTLGTWMLSILRHKIIDHYRKSHRQANDINETLETAPSFSPAGKWLSSPARWRQTPDQLAENAEFWHIVEGCLEDLPVHLAHAFELREIGLLSVEEASRQSGITPKNLAVRLHRARLLLRSCLERKWFQRSSGVTP